MTLRETLKSGPFYPQAWYDGEAFLLADVPASFPLPKKLTRPGFTPTPGNPNLPSVAELVRAYLDNPNAPIWRFWLWTRDVDRHGQAVYVGGIGHDDTPGLQIHRHLTITDRWRVPA